MDHIYMLVLALIILAVAYNYYSERKFYIGRGNEDILNYLKSLEHCNNISIIKTRVIKDKKLVMFKKENLLGIVVLGKCRDERYKVEKIKYSNGSMALECYKNKKNKYIVVYGFNGSNKIHNIGFNISENLQRLNLYDEEYFFKVWPMDKEEKEYDMLSLKAYDSKNYDITDKLEPIKSNTSEENHMIFSN
ncbi:hypothetical protein SAMN02745163_02491 [Clostridium cavendishii DSM 21758]|uniref:Uncharacterized protein n=1 Tax=Clostridium cavendishii DSM 21758 TaxID=1121302 RepID=A0A1M6LTQ8_9CLOT|nr:hypothetical protein [Clostridium cavendishii]SHJ74506.1 hypothetical protein SAMN02745163_02491 [Clostridium cavendishii DSM 21758]